ncbi:OadG family protein [Anaerolineales bacterium HSG24]|nr:OadG family protein [Anaerolineales bacterium HSG24]
MDTTVALMTGLKITLIGMSVVFFALAVITVILSNFDRLDQMITIAPHVHAPPKREGDSIIISDEDDEVISPEIVAVISAAISVAIDKKVRIKRIRYRHKITDNWQAQGRTDIMGSHQPNIILKCNKTTRNKSDKE